MAHTHPRGEVAEESVRVNNIVYIKKEKKKTDTGIVHKVGP